MPHVLPSSPWGATTRTARTRRSFSEGGLVGETVSTSPKHALRSHGANRGEQGMVKLIVLYGQPKSAAEFEKYYAETHMPIAGQMQGVRRIELAKVVGTPDGGPAPFYRTAELYFDDVEHMNSVMATPEAQRTVTDIANFATGGAIVLIAEVQ